MNPFFILFLLVCGGMNAYVLWRLTGLLPWPGWARLAAATPVWLAGLFMFPLIRLAGEKLSEAAIRLLLAANFIWVAWIFWLGLLFVLLDAGALGFRLARRPPPFSHEAGVLGALALVVVLTAVSYAIAENPRLKQMELTTRKLPPGTPPVRIALISDLHAGVLTTGHWTRRVLRLIEEARPDLVLLAGDALDTPDDATRRVLLQFSGIRAPLGRYGVIGNHEHYAGLAEASRDIQETMGFTLVNDAIVPLGDHLQLAGVADRQHYGEAGNVDEGQLFPDPDRSRFSIVLKHRPLVDPRTAEWADLQLSGHTHHGQIFPFGLLVRLQFPLPDGRLVPVGRAGMRLYATPGTGTWGPPLRLFIPGEVTLLVISPEPAAAARPPESPLP